MACVLAVDDLKSMRHMMSLTLSDAGFEVKKANNGREALQKLVDARPDLILADIDMPKMDGLELTRSIRTNPALANIPVLLVSTDAQSGELDIPRAKAAGADGWLCKPLNSEQLVDAINRLVLSNNE